ncbi:MAG: hypothetical protein ACRDV9_07375 [Acidimicrobiia bacterium]
MKFAGPALVRAAVRCREMASLDDAARMALDLPEVAEGDRHGNRSWSVSGKVFA